MSNSNVTYIRVGNSIILKSFANYSDIQNSTDLVLWLDNNMGDSHMKSSISIALTVAACAFLLSCYSCCCFNRFSSWTHTNGLRSRLRRSPFINQNRRQHDHHHNVSNRLNEETDDASQDRTNSPNQAEIIRRYDLDVESLPSYTIVSGLPSYDDALDQFRKAGIIIQQPSLIKIFEDVQIKSPETTENEDNISVQSCTCGGGGGGGGGVGVSPTGGITTTTTVAPVIELNPEQLKMLSQKRLSLQIALNSSVRQSCNRSRVDLCREVNRSNLLRSHDIPQIHRSTSSLCTDRNFVQRLAQLHQHRGSIA